MKGHEYAREVVRTYLEDTVPTFLAAHLAANDLDDPDPDLLEFLLVDDLSMVKRFPVVLVRSTDSPAMQSDGALGWIVRYQVEIVVACDSRVHGDYQGASQARDRVLLACREALLSIDGLPDDVDIPPQRMAEQTGAAAETLSGQPIAAGTITFPVVVSEVLRVPSPPETITNVDLTVDSADAAHPLEES